MASLCQRYREGREPLADRILAWPLRGVGVENLGENGRPMLQETPTCGPEELLVRVDAVGLCSSDAKMIRLGDQYPLFRGRDLSQEPTRLGHEVALTVIQAGERWRNRYHRGQRLGIQPDVFVNGERCCFGVLLPGGLVQYLTLGPEILAGDAGSYVFPVSDALSHADVALLEPWACVEAAYTPRRRLDPLPGGVLWIKGHHDDSRSYHMGCPIVSRRVVLTDVPEVLAAWVRTQVVEFVEWNGAEAAQLVAEYADDVGFDDIILLDPRTPDEVSIAADQLAPKGTLTVVRDKPFDVSVPLDVGRIHYEGIAYLGCPGPNIAEAFNRSRNRSDLKPGGVLWVVGAGGPLGRMHVQRALQMRDGPRAVIATNRGEARLAALQHTFGPLAKANDREFVALNPEPDSARLNEIMARLTGVRGCDDIVVMVPDIELIAEAAGYLASDGLLVLFAGVPLGNKAPLPLDNVFLHGAQITGTSGSTLEDQLRVLERTQSRQLWPAQSVAAIAGMYAVADGMRAVMEHTFPGKVIVYPNLPDLPLLRLSELRSVLPQVYAQLGPGETWTVQAERLLFERFW